MPNSQKKYSWDSPTCLFWLRVVLSVYIVLCFLIAGLNFGYAKQANPAIAKWITWFWHFYENWIKTFFVLIGALLTLCIVRKSSRITLRKSNLFGLSITALVVHIFLPLLLKNPELYLFSMPLPWNSAPLQILNPSSPMYQKYLASWSATGIHLVLLFQLFLSLVVIISTLLFGRRAQCSTLCLFNGFASEIFSPVFPLIGKASKPKPSTLKVLMILKWLFFIMALFFTLYWFIVLLFPSLYFAKTAQFLGQLEVYKYLLFELILMMLFWIFLFGRGYCLYCPLGTLLGYISRLSRQCIETNRSKCIECGKCNQTCPMSIHIMEKAREKSPVMNLNCVGCGYCVDVCPTQTIAYTTTFLKNTVGTVPLVRFGGAMRIQLDDTRTLPFIDPILLDTHSIRIQPLHQQLHGKTGPGYEFLGWVDQPGNITPDLVSKIKEITQDFRSRSQCFVLVGIGGSYAGARSAIEFYQAFQPSLPSDAPEIFYAGIDLSPVSVHRLLHTIRNKDITLNVVSKSGGTFETSATFQLLLNEMKHRYTSEELKKRILITTDPVKGALRQFANNNSYPTLPVDVDIGGRYSVLTPVGLFPMAMMGVPIEDLLDGARQAMNELNSQENPAYRYALLRHILSLKTAHIEALSTFEPAFQRFTEWWKQLFGESEGKNHKGLFPVGLQYSTDLHSLGQYMQDGKRILLETFLTIASLPPHLQQYKNPLTQTSYEVVNQSAKESTMRAHFDGGLPCLSLQIPDTTMQSLGYLYYFMMKACAMSSYLHDVNPFNQPGVEKYKSYMQE